MRAIVLALAISFPAFGADNVALVHEADPEMNAAIARARQTFDNFLKLKSQSPQGVSGFIVKVRIETEHLWVSPFRPNGKGGFEGILKSEPRNMPSLKWGQQVNFVAEQVSDWGYSNDGKLEGFFTTCVLLARDSNLRKQLKEQGRNYACAA